MLLDIIRKPIGKVLDLRISEDFSQIYVVDQPLIDEAANEIPRMNLYFINSEKINTDRNVSVSQKVFRPVVAPPLEQLPKVPLSTNSQQNQKEANEAQRKNIFAVVGMSMVGGSQGPLKAVQNLPHSHVVPSPRFKPFSGRGGGAGPSLSKLKSNLKDQIQRATEFD